MPTFCYISSNYKYCKYIHCFYNSRDVNILSNRETKCQIPEK